MAAEFGVSRAVSANVLISAFWGQDAMMPKAIIQGGENTLSSRSKDVGEGWGKCDKESESRSSSLAEFKFCNFAESDIATVARFQAIF